MVVTALMETDSLFWRTKFMSCSCVLENCWTAFLFGVCIWWGGREALSSYYSPVLLVKHGCGSAVLSPISTDWFKHLILVFSLITKQFGDTMWKSLREMHCALEVGSFLFLCNIPVWKSSELCVLCFLCIWTKTVSVCRVWWLLSWLTKIAGPLIHKPAWKHLSVFPAPLSGDTENGQNAGREPRA